MKKGRNSKEQDGEISGAEFVPPKETDSASNDLGKITARTEKELDGKANSGKTPRNRVIRRTVTQKEAECVDILLQASRCSSEQEMSALVYDGLLTKLLGMTLGRQVGRQAYGAIH